MAEIAAIAAGAGALIQAVGGVIGGVQAKDAAYEQAKLIQEQGDKELKTFTRQGEALRSRQAAAVGASGVKVEGSPMLVMLETAKQLEEDERWIKRQTDLAVKATKKAGDAALTNSLIGAAGSLLTSGSQLYQAYSGYFGPKQTYQYTNKYPGMTTNLGRPYGY